MSELISTTLGPMEARFLKRADEIIDNDRERTQIIQYFFQDTLVHRSVHIQLKQGLGIEAALAQL